MYIKYNDPSYLSTDPLGIVLELTNDPIEIEWIGFFVSVLSFGRVEQIRKICRTLFQRTGPEFSDFLISTTDHDLHLLTRDLYYRFYQSDDLLFLLAFIKHLIGKGKTIRQFMKLTNGLLDHAGLTAAWKQFSEESGYNSYGVSYMIPDGRKGSAQKRLWMFSRWMVRRDAIDPGIWQGFSASALLMPLDTHTSRICYFLGLSNSRVANRRNAEQITSVLRQLTPDDPVKYDFAISRLGILQECPSRLNEAKCEKCNLFSVCSR